MDARSFPAARWSTNLKDFEVDDNLEKLPVGLLTFDGESRLELNIPIGCLLDWPFEPCEDGYVQFHTVGGLRADALFGFSQRGDWYVLRDAYSPGPSLSEPGFQSQDIIARSLLTTRKPCDSNPAISRVDIMIPGLREWVDRPSGQETSTFNRASGRKTIKFSFDTDEVMSIPLLDHDDASISIRFYDVRKGGPVPSFSFEFESDCFVRFKFPRGALRLDDAIQKWVFPTSDFISFCMGAKYSIARVRFATVDGVEGDYYAPLLGKKSLKDAARPLRFPYPLREIEDDAGRLLETWLDFRGYARSASNLLVSLMDDWKMPLDMVFLATAQVFEAASRIGVDDREIDDDELTDKLKAIKESNLSSKMKKWVSYKLKNAKWKTANVLADGLLERISPAAEYIVPNVKVFKRDHRSLRDSITHRREPDEWHDSSSFDLYWHMGAVRALSYIAISVALGIPCEKALDCLKRSHYLENEIVHSRKMYALTAEEVGKEQSKCQTEESSS